MEKRNRIKVSLIIATYNRAPVLGRTLDVLLAQTLPHELWELVVVDNNSPDNTRAAAEEFAAAHPEINMRVVTETAQGVSHARNRGVAESVGEYIVVIDDDEDAIPGLLQQYFDLFEKHPDVMAAGGRIIPAYQNHPPKWLSPRTERAIAGTVNFGRKIGPIPRGKFFGGGNHGVRRTLFEQYGGYNTTLGRVGKDLLAGEEKELYFRFKAAGAKIYYLPEAIIYHHIEPERLTEEYFRRLCLRIGRSEKVRKLGVSGPAGSAGLRNSYDSALDSKSSSGYSDPSDSDSSARSLDYISSSGSAGSFDLSGSSGGGKTTGGADTLRGKGNGAMVLKTSRGTKNGATAFKTSRGAYAKRLFMEAVKWGGALTLAAGWLFCLQPAKSRYLLIMRWEITKGLLSRIES